MYSLKLIVTKKLEITFLCNYYLILKKLQNELQTVHVYLLVKELQTVHVYLLVKELPQCSDRTCISACENGGL
jgi:hypothetical protein